jgi:poly(hydroxyalkanoate) granule-associated protein
MAARKTRTARGASKSRPSQQQAEAPAAGLIENVQQIWLAGMGAIARAQQDGPAAFQDAVSEGLDLLARSRSQTEQVIRDAFESAQGSVQSRLGTAREQAGEAWDNLESLFQSRVQRALQQLGVPSPEEIRLLTQRVAELNDSVQALQASRVAGGRKRAGASKPATARARRKVRSA